MQFICIPRPYSTYCPSGSGTTYYGSWNVDNCSDCKPPKFFNTTVVKSSVIEQKPKEFTKELTEQVTEKKALEIRATNQSTAACAVNCAEIAYDLSIIDFTSQICFTNNYVTSNNYITVLTQYNGGYSCSSCWQQKKN